MSDPEIETPASPALAAVDIERTVTITGRFPGMTLQREGDELPTVFEPSEGQAEWMVALLDQDFEEMDPEEAAFAVGVQLQLPGWRLQPGFTEWAEREITRAGALDMAVMKAGVLRRASKGDPKAVALALKLFPQVVERRVVDPDAFTFTASERIREARAKLEAGGADVDAPSS